MVKQGLDKLGQVEDGDGDDDEEDSDFDEENLTPKVVLNAVYCNNLYIFSAIEVFNVKGCC